MKTKELTTHIQADLMVKRLFRSPCLFMYRGCSSLDENLSKSFCEYLLTGRVETLDRVMSEQNSYLEEK